MQLSPAIVPIEIVTQLIASTSRLAQGALPVAVLTDLSLPVSRWQQEHPELQSSLRPITSLLPPSGEAFDREEGSIGDGAPVSEPVPTPTREHLARALRDTGSNLSVYSQGLETQLLGVLREKLQSIIHESLIPVPISVLLQESPREASSELIQSQMAQTLRILVGGTTHDANNMLSVLRASQEEAEEHRERLQTLANKNRHLVPEGVARYLEITGSLQTHMNAIKGFIDLTVDLVREVRSMAGLMSPSSETEAVDLSPLFVDQGVVSRIGLALVDLLTGLKDAGRDLAGMYRIAEEYGHLAPPEDLAEATELRRNIGECLETLQECTDLLVDLFRVLRSVAETLGPVDLNRHLNRRLIGRVMGKGVALFLNTDPSPWMIPGPAIHAWQVGMNLMVNARDAMGEGGRLEIETYKEALREKDIRDLIGRASLIRPAPRTGDYMVLKVKDNGSGIPSEILSNIFDLTFSRKGSSGLGLAVTLKIIEDMGGFIAVQTAVEGADRGTTFSIYFPRLPEIFPAAPPSRPRSPKGNETVLIADDEPSVVKAIKRQLESRGFRVMTAANGEEAVKLCDGWYGESGNSAISLILLDVNMPGLSGAELIERLRGIDPEMACLFHTGGHLPRPLQGVERSSVIEKPADLGKMVRAIRSLLDEDAAE